MTTPSTYGVVKLKDYVYFQEGPGIRNSQNTSEGVKFLNIRCFVDGRLDTTSMKKVSEHEAYGKYKHFLLDVGDYVVSSSGTLGRIAEVYPEDIPVMLNTSTIRFRPIKNELLDRLYLRYFLESEVFQQQVKSLATGSVQLNYGPSHLAFVEMPLPPIKSQRAIGQTLDNLTKKINSNNSISKTLEDIAQAIFKSWFIDFDPVKAKMNGEKPVGMDDKTAALFPDSFEESELGLIPKGWEVLTFGEACEIKQGKYLAPAQMSELPNESQNIPVIGGNGILGFTSKSTFDFDVPLVTCRGSRCGLLQWAIYPTWVSNNAMAIKLKSSSDYAYFLYLLLRQLNFENVITGSAQPQITVTNLSFIKIMLPSESVIKAFVNATEIMRKLIVHNERENQSLVEIRESLLPRLISGELQIPDEMLAS